MCASQSRSASTLSFELKIIRAKNVNTQLKGNFFVRFYLSAGNNQRIRLNAQEISSKGELFWDESFSLECCGTEGSIKNLKEQSIVFELRRRSTKPFVGKFAGSQLVGRGEMPWKSVLQAPEMGFQSSWVPVTMPLGSGCVAPEGVEPPALLVAMKVKVVMSLVNTERKNRFRVKERDECGCSSCVDSELLAVATALEGF
ncbi:hypothetical protein Ancab_026330 [Ancistrocladus abbreviatus]